jgi:hypothetical protein
MVRPSPWFFGGAPGRTTEERLDALVDRLQDLESLVDTVYRDLSSGPLDSQYLSLTLGADEPAGTALPDVDLDVRSFPFEAEIVFLQYFCLGGSATVDIESDGTSLRPASLTSGATVFYNEASDLPDPARVTGDLTLVKLSTDAGTPHRIRAWIVLKRVSRIEPT